MPDRRIPEKPMVTFVKGYVGGVGAGILTVALPPIGVLMLGAGAVATARVALTDPGKRPHVLVLCGGFLLGLGALLLYGSWNVIAACRETTDFCGNANVVPLLTAGIVVVAAGCVAVVAAFRASRPE